MASILWKSFNLFVSKFKCFPTAMDENDRGQKFLTDAPSVFQNFNSLYDAGNFSDTSPSKSVAFSSAAAAEEATVAFSSEVDGDSDSVPDFSSAFASDRLFFSSPGTSNSIIVPLEPPPPPDYVAVVSGGAAVQTYSPDPYSDFRKSMAEMIESREVTNVSEDWEILHQLLLCYLKLNPKHTHKLIVRAFADVVVSLVAAGAGDLLPTSG